MKPSWKPVKRGPEVEGYSRYWWETLVIALAEALAANLSLLLLPTGYVLQWGWCAVDWWARRAAKRDRKVDGDE